AFAGREGVQHDQVQGTLLPHRVEEEEQDERPDRGRQNRPSAELPSDNSPTRGEQEGDADQPERLAEQRRPFARGGSLRHVDRTEASVRIEHQRYLISGPSPAIASAAFGDITATGQGPKRTTRSVVPPNNLSSTPPRPCVAMTTRLACRVRASSAMASAAWPIFTAMSTATPSPSAAARLAR